MPPADFKVQCELGCKFGCPPKKARQLLEAAKRLELNVVGVRYIIHLIILHVLYWKIVVYY